MKPVLHIFVGWLLGIVLAFVIFCLGGAIWDAWAAPDVSNPMVGHAPGGLTYGGFALLCWLIPCFGPLCLLAVFAVLLIAVIAGDAAFSQGRRGRPPRVLEEAMHRNRFDL